MAKAKRKYKRIGLIPAGGLAERIAPLPCSKEVFPVGFHSDSIDQELRPKVICQYLLESMQAAGVEDVFIILRKGKWDIPEYLGDGKRIGIPIGYLIMDLPFGAPFTLDQAYPFVKDAMIFLGFPDILFKPIDALKMVSTRQRETNADVVMGLFPADNPRKTDMVEFEPGGRVQRIDIKPSVTELKYTWIIAVWTPRFTEFIHEFVTDFRKKESLQEDARSGKKYKEYHIGEVLQEAININMSVNSIIIEKGRYIDIGTPRDLRRAVRAECGSVFADDSLQECVDNISGIIIGG